jgi:hypothetical protein
MRETGRGHSEGEIGRLREQIVGLVDADRVRVEAVSSPAAAVEWRFVLLLLLVLAIENRSSRSTSTNPNRTPEREARRANSSHHDQPGRAHDRPEWTQFAGERQERRPPEAPGGEIS